MNAILKKRLLRLEQDSSFQRELIGQEILDVTLRGLNDSELVLLKSFIERGAQLTEATAEERSAIERFQALYQTASSH